MASYSLTVTDEGPVYYDDPSYDYRTFWLQRQYEHQSEVIAIRRLLKNKSCQKGIDLGGGYGRLTPLLKEYCEEVTLIDPSSQQLNFAKERLKSLNIKYQASHASNMNLKDNSTDLVLMVRMSHYLADPIQEFKEIYRILKPNGNAIVEIANYNHFLNRYKHIITAKRMPLNPTPIGKLSNNEVDPIPFYNHNPKTIEKQLIEIGFRIDKKLSVSNLRNQIIKRVLPKSVMLGIEDASQVILSKVYFGPSIFFLVTKT